MQSHAQVSKKDGMIPTSRINLLVQSIKECDDKEIDIFLSLTNLTEEDKHKILEIAQAYYNIPLIKKLSNENETLQLKLIFDRTEKLLKKKNIEKTTLELYFLMRLNTFELIKECWLKYNSKKSTLLSCWEKAKTLYFNTRPYIAPCSNYHLNYFANAYKNTEEKTDFRDSLKSEIKFAEKRREFSKNSIPKIFGEEEKPNKTKINYADITLKIFGEQTLKRYWEKSPKTDERIEQTKHPMNSHSYYTFSCEIARRVLESSDAEDLEVTYNSQKKRSSYKLFWKNGSQVSSVLESDESQPYICNIVSNHRFNLEYIKEVIHDKIKNIIRLKTHKYVDKEKNKKDLLKFYSEISELIWFICNTKPLKNHNGSYAEYIFSILHEYHNIPLPIVKKEYQQLKIMSNILPLSEFILLFLGIFEKKSLPKLLRSDIKDPIEFYNESKKNDVNNLSILREA